MTETPVQAAFRSQARACADLGSPFMARLMTLCATRDLPPGPVATRLTTWPGALGPGGASVPLRLAGALHALRRDGNAALAAAYPPANASDDALWSAVETTLLSEASAILALLDSPPQTNEVRRSVALIPAALWLSARYRLPLDLLELGASAGLNLAFDRYALFGPGWHRGPADAVLSLAPDWHGPPPPEAQITVASRAGVDLNPLSAHRDADRLMAYLWPDQPDRAALTDAALAELRRLSPDLAQADAGNWLAARLTPRAGRLQLVMHTVAWQYFSADTAARADAALVDAGARATKDAPIARLSMENDGALRGAALTLTTWPGGVTHALGRVDFHGRWLTWTPPKEAT